MKLPVAAEPRKNELYFVFGAARQFDAGIARHRDFNADRATTYETIFDIVLKLDRIVDE